jgi:hypothetical protein
MRRRPQGVPRLDSLVEVGERERDGCDHCHQAVLRDQLAAVERRTRERAHAIRRAGGLRPVPRGDGRKAPRADSFQRVGLAVGAKPRT